MAFCVKTLYGFFLSGSIFIFIDELYAVTPLPITFFFLENDGRETNQSSFYADLGGNGYLWDNRER